MKNGRLINTVRTFITENNCRKVTVALSGGCDSVALLSSLHTVLGSGNIFAVHVNHGIRGHEADRDEKFCITLCERLDIPLKVYHYDIPSLAKEEATGLEECARKYRYLALRHSCDSFGTFTVATAHNANDNAESLLFNLCRGTGLGGASGIPRIRKEHGMTVIRPILPILRSEIVEYVISSGLSYVTDSTNSDTVYTRNYIRANVIPHLTAVNEKALTNIMSCTEIISDADDFINECSARFIADTESSGDTVYVPRESFCSLHRAVKSTVLCNLYTRLSGEVLSRTLVQSALELIANSEPGSTVDLPMGIELCNCGKSFSLSPKRSKENYNTELKIGMNDFSEFGFNIIIINDPEENFVRQYKNIYNFVKWSILNTDMIKGTLSARRRTDGDRYTVSGMNRRIKNLLSDKKIPHDKRHCYPIISDTDGVVCVPGCPVKDGYDGRNSEHKTYIIYTNSKKG